MAVNKTLEAQLMAGCVTRLLERHGPMTVRDLCYELRRAHRIDLTPPEFGRRLAANPQLRGRLERRSICVYCGPFNSTATQYSLRG